MKLGPFDALSGNSSSARIYGGVIIGIALVISIFIACVGRDDVVKLAGAIAIQFPAMTGPVLLYLFKNKQSEIGHEEAKQETILLTDKMPTND